MRIAFYAPLKPPDDPVPSGDRRMAQLLVRALSLAGHEVELVSRFRSRDGAGVPARQMRVAAVGSRLAERLTRRLLARAPADRPRLFFTYHLYYKAPDWIGPRVATALGIPYVVVEASLEMKRAGGRWSTNHEAVVAALARVAAVMSMHARDEAGVAPAVAHRARLHRLKPFLEAETFTAAMRERASSRAALAARFALPQDEPWLLAVGMMRHGDKLASYRRLGEVLVRIMDRPWRLLVVGDGRARSEVEEALRPLGARVAWLGEQPPEAMPDIHAAADLFTWPAINEAYGLALLEAHAAGVPVVAGDFGGVSEIVRNERTGILVAAGEVERLAAAVATLLDDPERRRAMGRAAWTKVSHEHDVAAAGAALDRVLAAALRGVP